MRNGNPVQTWQLVLHSNVLTVPMRNGNPVTSMVLRQATQVLTVPMRNGNLNTSYAIQQQSKGSYRTYEEWKLDWKKWNLSLHYEVLTVPMRNGNLFLLPFPFLFHEFLPYLWGMETPTYRGKRVKANSSYRTYEEWKLIGCIASPNAIAKFLPYLWGMETLKGDKLYPSPKRFLPYLWGMETSSHHPHSHKFQCRFLPYLWGMETRQ